MRVFIGIEIDAEGKESLFQISEQLRAIVQKGNFTTKGNFHITVKFIGDMKALSFKELQMASCLLRSEDKRDVLMSALKRTAGVTEPFDLMLDAYGVFSKAKGDILWIGSSNAKPFEELAKRVEAELSELFDRVSSEVPVLHVTLARGCRLDLDTLKKIPFQPIRVTVNRLCLFESARVDHELVYRPIATESFKNL